MRSLCVLSLLLIACEPLAVPSAPAVPPADEVSNGASVFDASVLHQIEIVVAEEHWRALDEDIEQRVPCTFSYDGVTVAGAGIRKKGQTSMRPLADKPSFSVKLDDADPSAEIDGVEKLILNNTLQDPTYLSEPMTYALYQRAGIPAPRTAHAVLRLNGVSKGIYVVVEAVDKDFLKQHFGDGTGNLYEGPWDFPMGAQAADLKDEDEGRNREDLGALTTAVLESDDAALEGAVEQHLDVTAFLRSVAVDMSILAWDGYAITAWNFYLYCDPATDKFVLLPHGADWPYWHAEVDPFFPGFRPWGEEYPPGHLAERAVAAPGLSHRYREQLAFVRDRAFDVDTMIGQIDGIAAVVRQADRADPVLDLAVAELDAHVEEGRAFVRARRAYLDGLSLP